MQWTDRLQAHASRPLAALLITLALWSALAGFFIRHTGDGSYTHDLSGHVDYTRIVTLEHRLPRPYEKWETFQPPLYYVISGLLSRQDSRHIARIRIVSAVYGALFLMVMFLLLRELTSSAVIIGVVLSFIATTPKFLFIFSSYNNDSLATLLSAVIILLAWRLMKRWTHAEGALLLGFATAALYVKLTAALTLFAVGGVLTAALFARQVPLRSCMRLYLVFLAAVALLAPWLIGHNYVHTRKLFPSNFENGLGPELAIESPWKTLVTPPGFSHQEWGTPFVSTLHSVGSKKNSFTAFLFSNSVFGEYQHSRPPAWLAWLLLYLHLFVCFQALRHAMSGRIPIMAAGLILSAIILQGLFVIRSPCGPSMDYRYIAWTSMLLGVLYEHHLGQPMNSRQRFLSMSPYVAGVVAQIVFIGYLCE